MAIIEENINVPNNDKALPLTDSPPGVSTIIADLVILTVAAAFAMLAFCLFLGAMLVLPGALLIGLHAFQLMGIMACVGGVCLLIALGLCARHVAAWWIGVTSSFVISLSAVLHLLEYGSSQPFRWAAGVFIAAFVALLCIRRHFTSTREL